MSTSAAIGESSDLNEAAHYVVTAHQPDGVILSTKCSFIDENSLDVVIAKPRRIEVRQLSAQSDEVGETSNMDDEMPPSLPLVLSIPIHGRITSLLPFRTALSKTDYIFFTTESKKYAVISYSNKSSSPNKDSDNTPALHFSNVMTHASGDLVDYGISIRGREAECGPIAALEPNGQCIALHLYDGFLSFLPIQQMYNPSNVESSTSLASKAVAGTSANLRARMKKSGELLGVPFHCRIEERTVLSIAFLFPKNRIITNKKSGTKAVMPQLAMLHQDSRGNQHVIAHSVDLYKKSLVMYSQVENGPTNTSKKSSNPFIPPPINVRLKRNRVEGGSGLIVPVPPVGCKLQSMTAYDETNDVNMMVDSQSQKMPAKVSDSKEQFGGVLIMGQKQITYHCTADATTKFIPIAHSVIVDVVLVDNTTTASESDAKKEQDPDFTARYLLTDESGKMHVLAITRTNQGKVTGLHLDTLGITSTAQNQTLVYLKGGFVYVGSPFGDSQFIQILDEPINVPATNPTGISSGDSNGTKVTYLNVLDEHTNLGPIVDFDLMPTKSGGVDANSILSPQMSSGISSTQNQSMVITASGAGKDGTIRLIRNGIGLSQHAEVELAGIKGMWNIRKTFQDIDDLYLIQSYVGETRVLGVVVEEDEEEVEGGEDNEEKMEDYDDESEYDEEGTGTLEEVNITGLDSTRSTLYAGNIAMELNGEQNIVIQITEVEIRLINIATMESIYTWTPTSVMEDVNAVNLITVASANDSGQIVVALRGGILMYLSVVHRGDSVEVVSVGSSIQLDQEICCMDLNPFDKTFNNDFNQTSDVTAMEIDSSVQSTKSSQVVAVGLWNEYSVRLLSLDSSSPLREVLRINLGPDDLDGRSENIDEGFGNKDSQFDRNMMARSLCLVTLEPSSSTGSANDNKSKSSSINQNRNQVNMLLVGLGDGGLVSFAVKSSNSGYSVDSRKDVNLGTRGVNLVPFKNRIVDSGTCVLATGDRPTIIYLAGGGGGNNINPKLCFSNIGLSNESGEDGETTLVTSRKNLIVNIATPFFSSLLFENADSSTTASSGKNYSLCVSDESTMRLGVIDDIQKLHVSTHKLGMAPRCVAHHESGHSICVGCIDDGAINSSTYSRFGTEVNMGNCIRFFDDSSFEEIDRFDLDPYEMILSLVSMKLKITKDNSSGEVSNSKDDTTDAVGDQSTTYNSYIAVGTAYALPDEDEPSRGRIILIQCHGIDGGGELSRKARQISEIQLKGGVYSICPFYNGTFLASINSKTRIFSIFDSGVAGVLDLKVVGSGHHGNVLSLCVRSKIPQNPNDGSSHKKGNKRQEQIAIVGDLMSSISVLKYYPKYQCLEEVARDYNQNMTTAVEMLNENTYIGGENFNNLFTLRRNANSKSEELRCRLDTTGLFNLGEMPNKFMEGTLVMPSSSTSAQNASSSSTLPSRKVAVGIGSQTLFATVDGTLGSILGLDAKSAAFFAALECAMARVIRPIGDLKHFDFRAYRGEKREEPCRGFVDGDMVESFLDLDHRTMELVVGEMNKERDWIVDYGDDEDTKIEGEHELKVGTDTPLLTVNDVLIMVEEISMLH